MTLHHLSEPGKHILDYAIAGWGFAVLLNILPVVSGFLAAILLVLRIGIGLQEWRINRRKLKE